MELKVVGLQ
jgi:hypothetical protein